MSKHDCHGCHDECGNCAEDSLNFLKEAFCVDGDAKFVSTKDGGFIMPEMVAELNDSERGTIYVAILKRRLN